MIKLIIRKEVRTTKMKKLEEIPKKIIFTVPDNYFDKLPGIIQSRTVIENKFKKPFLGYVVRYGLPTIALVAILFWFLLSTTTRKPDADAESLLAVIETEDLVAYLNDSDLTSDEVMEFIEFNIEDLNEIEERIFEIDLSEKESENIFDEIDLDL